MVNAAAVAKDKKEAEEIARRFGQNLRRARKRAAMSQEELAIGASLHRTEIGLIERGHRVARIDTLIKIASSLEVSPLDLLAGIEWTAGGPSRGRFSIKGPLPQPPRRGRSS
ncbi:MAG: helix-turn-helix transcriptional regulator [Actinobacteria bacterium]|nr:helix-turn-helix transcriptional regulator [Actinomycetota bacterium]